MRSTVVYPLLLSMIGLLVLGGCDSSVRSPETNTPDDEGTVAAHTGVGTTPEDIWPDPLRTLYVAPDGEDSGDGSQISPWRTLAHAAGELLPGDLLIVRPGDYEGGVVLDRSGTAQAWIRIVAPEGATVDAMGELGITVAGSYVELRGFSVEGPGSGILVGDDLPFRNDVCNNLDAYIDTLPEEEREEERAWMEPECQAGAPRPAENHRTTHVILDGALADGRRARLAPAGPWETGVRIEDEAAHILIRNYEIVGGRSGIFADPAESLKRIDGLTLDRLWVHDTSYYGVRIVARQRWRFIEGGDGPQYMYWQEDGRPLVGSVEPIAIRTQRITDLIVRDSLFENNAFTNPETNEGYGNMLLQGIDGGLVERSRFIDAPYWGLDALMCDDFLYRNNIFYFSPTIRERQPRFNEWPTTGLEINGGTGNRVYNNLFIGGEAGVFESLFPEDFVLDALSVDIRNNLFVDNVTSIARFPLSTWLESEEVEPNPVMEYVPVGGFEVDRQEHSNLMDVGVNVELDGSQFLGEDPEFFGTGNIILEDLDPRFVDPTALDFRLRAGSPAVDAAEALDAVPGDLDGVERPRGTAYDIGPFESH